MSNFERFLDTFFNGKVMLKYLPDILHGMVVTIELAVLIIVSGLAAGLSLALIRSLAIRPLNWLIIFIVDLFRSLPPLVIIVLMYFGLPYADVSPSGFVSTWLSLALVLMAFSEEIFWAGITSVHKGQWEASRSTGLSFGQTLMNVVLPQALRLTIRRSPTAPSPSPRAPPWAPLSRSPKSWARRARRFRTLIIPRR